MRMRKKIGPLSLDSIVACQIHEISEEGERAEFSLLLERLEHLMSKQSMNRQLRHLVEIGILTTEAIITRSGRAGRLWSITPEAEKMIAETYELFWDQIPKKEKKDPEGCVTVFAVLGDEDDRPVEEVEKELKDLVAQAGERK